MSNSSDKPGSSENDDFASADSLLEKISKEMLRSFQSLERNIILDDFIETDPDDPTTYKKRLKGGCTAWVEYDSVTDNSDEDTRIPRFVIELPDERRVIVPASVLADSLSGSELSGSDDTAQVCNAFFRDVEEGDLFRHYGGKPGFRVEDPYSNMFANEGFGGHTGEFTIPKTRDGVSLEDLVGVPASFSKSATERITTVPQESFASSEPSTPIPHDRFEDGCISDSKDVLPIVSSKDGVDVFGASSGFNKRVSWRRALGISVMGGKFFSMDVSEKVRIYGQVISSIEKLKYPIAHYVWRVFSKLVSFAEEDGYDALIAVPDEHPEIYHFGSSDIIKEGLPFPGYGATNRDIALRVQEELERGALEGTDPGKALASAIVKIRKEHAKINFNRLVSLFMSHLDDIYIYERTLSFDSDSDQSAQSAVRILTTPEQYLNVLVEPCKRTVLVTEDARLVRDLVYSLAAGEINAATAGSRDISLYMSDDTINTKDRSLIFVRHSQRAYKKARREFASTAAGHVWLESDGGIEYLLSDSGKRFLDSQQGREFLKSPYAKNFLKLKR